MATTPQTHAPVVRFCVLAGTGGLGYRPYLGLHFNVPNHLGGTSPLRGRKGAT